MLQKLMDIKINYAVRMYEKVGFEIARENEDDYIMICKL
jgi:ribosomal protein S18 acetylase RimI-like enzyme